VLPAGEVSERFKEHAWKACVGETQPWVRIPPSPPVLQTPVNRVVVDRKKDMRSWVDACFQIKKRGILIYAYANNHYAGHGPATIEQFRDLWYASGLPELERGRRMRLQTSLFDDPPTR
jgi:hypothetical protein